MEDVLEPADAAEVRRLHQVSELRSPDFRRLTYIGYDLSPAPADTEKPDAWKRASMLLCWLLVGAQIGGMREARAKELFTEIIDHWGGASEYVEARRRFASCASREIAARRFEAIGACRIVRGGLCCARARRGI